MTYVANYHCTDLFDDIGELESAAFGRTTKVSQSTVAAMRVDADAPSSDYVQDYERLLRQQEGSEYDQDDDSDDDDEDRLAQDDFDNLLGGDDFEAANEDETDDSAFGSNGISDEELRDPSDDDDHEEMLEPGSDNDSDDEVQVLNESDLESDIDGAEGADSDLDDDVDSNQRDRMVRFAADLEQGPTGATSTSDAVATKSALPTPSKGAYVPPHLRKAMEEAASAAAASATPTPSRDAPPSDPRLRRQLMGHLNKLSSLNIGNILSSIEAIYASHPRAVVSAELTSLLLEIIAGRDNLGEQLVINYAALVAALARFIGVEFPAGVVAKSVGMLDEALERNRAAAADNNDDDDTGFEGRPGSKECENIVAFIAEMYNFQIVACVIVYDLVKQFIQGSAAASDDDRQSEAGMSELEVELLAKIIKRARMH